MAEILQITNITAEELNNLLRTAIRDELASQPEKTELKYLSRNETAKILRLTLPTLLQYTKEGLIQGSRIGRRVLYSEESIQEAVKAIPQARYKRR